MHLTRAVLFRAGEMHLIRRRETLDDLLHLQIPLGD
jgi:hypothetical protein